MPALFWVALCIMSYSLEANTVLPWFYRWGNRGTERLSNLPRVTLLVSGRARILTHAVWLWNLSSSSLAWRIAGETGLLLGWFTVSITSACDFLTCSKVTGRWWQHSGLYQSVTSFSDWVFINNCGSKVVKLSSSNFRCSGYLLFPFQEWSFTVTTESLLETGLNTSLPLTTWRS